MPIQASIDRERVSKDDCVSRTKRVSTSRLSARRSQVRGPSSILSPAFRGGGEGPLLPLTSEKNFGIPFYTSLESRETLTTGDSIEEEVRIELRVSRNR